MTEPQSDSPPRPALQPQRWRWRWRSPAAGHCVAPIEGAAVLVVSGSVGAGHDGAAAELVRRLAEKGVLAEQRDFLDAVPRWLRFILREGYTLSVGHVPGFFDWLFNSVERTGWVLRLTLAVCGLARPTIRGWALDRRIVVSTYPLASQALGQLRDAGELAVPVVTFLTDPAVHRTWVHAAVDYHITVTELTARMGRHIYHTPMWAVGGLVRPGFARRDRQQQIHRLRAELGVHDALPVALIVGGSLGIGQVETAARAIGRSGAAQVIVVCGRNAGLCNRLRFAPNVVALGWRDDMPELMAMADVLVHNAGGLTFTEAMTTGLAAVTFLPIPGHGVANARVMHDSGLAVWARDEDELVAAIRRYGRRTPAPDPPGPALDASEFIRRLLLTGEDLADTGPPLSHQPG